MLKSKRAFERRPTDLPSSQKLLPSRLLGSKVNKVMASAIKSAFPAAKATDTYLVRVSMMKVGSKLAN